MTRIITIDYNEQESNYYISTESEDSSNGTKIPLKYVKSNRNMLKYLEDFCQWGINEKKLHTLKFEDADRLDSETKKGLCRIVGKINQDTKGWFPRNYTYID